MGITSSEFGNNNIIQGILVRIAFCRELYFVDEWAVVTSEFEILKKETKKRLTPGDRYCRRRPVAHASVDQSAAVVVPLATVRY